MAHPKISPDGECTEIVSFRLSRHDHERVKTLALQEDRPRTSQLRHLVKTALNLSDPPPEKKAPK